MFLYPFKKIYFETGKSKVSFKIDNRKSILIIIIIHIIYKNIN